MTEQLFNRQGIPREPTGHDSRRRPYFSTTQPCTRCGGQGGADKWKPTGWSCFRCGGKCIDPNKVVERLYTAEKNAQLDAVKAKRQAGLDAKREAKQKEIEERKAEIISGNDGFISRIDAELAHGDNELLQSVRERIMDSAKDPTDRQIEVVNQIVDRNTKERARVAAAKHVGEIGKRREFTLTLLYTRSDSSRLPSGVSVLSHWTLFTDENGCKVATKSAPWLLGLVQTYPPGKTHEGYYERGQTVRVAALVTKHEFDKNDEPVTYVNRPKRIEG